MPGDRDPRRDTDHLASFLIFVGIPLVGLFIAVLTGPGC